MYVCARTYTYTYACTYTYTYARAPALLHLTSPIPYISVSDVGCWFLLAVGAWWERWRAQLKGDAPRWSKADVYDRDLR